METFINFIESTSSLKSISIKAYPGKPAIFSENEMRNATIEYDVSYKGEIKKGKRWITAMVPLQRIGVAEVSFYQGYFTGDVWCLPEQYEECKQKLIANCKVAIQRQIEAMQLTFKSLS